MSEKARGGRREREERRDKCEGLTTLAKGCANASANRLDTLYASIRHFPLCARKHEGEGEGVKEGEKNERDKLPLTCVCVTYSIHTHTQTVVKLWYDVCIMCFLVINGIITLSVKNSSFHLTTKSLVFHIDNNDDVQPFCTACWQRYLGCRGRVVKAMD